MNNDIYLFFFSSLNNIIKIYVIYVQRFTFSMTYEKNRNNHEKFSDSRPAQLSFDSNTQLVFFYWRISININVNVFVLSIYLSVFLISMSNFSTKEKVYEWLHRISTNNKTSTNAQINKQKDSCSDGTALSSSSLKTRIHISRDDNDVYIYLAIDA
jgi:hypothetical protein